ncbi:MAG: hypothetical protein KTR25_20650 [Myxococcales bacterium]|nr:hypothetical protein [Myxococcales bacterium]
MKNPYRFPRSLVIGTSDIFPSLEGFTVKDLCESHKPVFRPFAIIVQASDRTRISIGDAKSDVSFIVSDETKPPTTITVDSTAPEPAEKIDVHLCTLHTAEITWVEPKFLLLRRAYAPLRDHLLILTELIQVVFTVLSLMGQK